MLGKAERKVFGGKLVKVKVDFNDRINSIKITGDFFLYPEEAIEKIENTVIGTKINETTGFFENKINETVKKLNIELLGFSAKDIAETIKQAVGK